MDVRKNLLIPNFNENRRLFKPVFQCIKKISAIEQLEKVYAKLPTEPDPRIFLSEALNALEMKMMIEGNLESIPKNGPLLVVGNHPYGGLEGLMTAKILLEVRSDVKIMVNYLLAHIPQLSLLTFGVDPFGSTSSRSRNITPLRHCVEWLKEGGTLIMFPSGTVSHLHVSKKRIMDPNWSKSVGQLVLWSQCSVLPIHFDGANSLLFQFLGLFHPRFRTLLLPRELHNKRGRIIKLTLGQVITFPELAKIGDPQSITEYLRARTYALGISTKNSRLQKNRLIKGLLPLQPKPVFKKQETIQDEVPKALLHQDARNLPEKQCLLESGNFRVFYAKADQIVNIMQEIGRLRELSFRAVGEGTGRSVDLDSFDQFYDHLFLWDESTHKIVGAYRIGRCDEIISLRGIDGLYTNSLFYYSKAMMPILEKSLELGRAFVRPEYQKNYAPLWLLWKGIAQYVFHHKNYRFLLGPVSISSSYHVLSRHLMLTYLSHHYFDEELSRLVKARHPWRIKPSAPWDVQTLCHGVKDVDLFSELILAIEKSERTIPVLLRHYIKIGAKVLGFNVDPHFSNVVDALILVDLTKIELSLLVKTMGRDKARRFLAEHGNEGFDTVSLTA